MRNWILPACATSFVALLASLLAAQDTGEIVTDNLESYAGVYQWGPDAFIYLQPWKEFAGFSEPSQLVAFDESGDVRVLYPASDGSFFAGRGVADTTSTESWVAFHRDGSGRVVSLTWQRKDEDSRMARRVDVEKREDVMFSNGDIQLAGTLIGPKTEDRIPAIILVHGSGPQDREYILPFARFLVRKGIAVFGYDKRGVGGSSGDWNTASFEDLAGDVLAAFEYLKTRDDIDSEQIGLMGVSQAGWIMPLAAVRAEGIAFMISVSGAGMPASITTIDQARNEMLALGRRPQMVSRVIDLMLLQYRFAETGEGWEEYLEARNRIAARIGGRPPEIFPGNQGHPSWDYMRLLYFYDPAPTLRQLQVPTLALFGELDNNIMAEKNKAAWEEALVSGDHPDYRLEILPEANHYLWEAKIGSNAEMASLQGFSPSYMATVETWLAERIDGFSSGD